MHLALWLECGRREAGGDGVTGNAAMVLCGTPKA